MGRTVDYLSFIYTGFKCYRGIQYESTQPYSATRLVHLWRQRLEIIAVIASEVEKLIHPWKDLAVGNFIMQI